MERARSGDLDYRDYVIKDGKFIGAFEEMYSNCADPWHQDAVQPLAEDLALFLLSKNKYNMILDIGCGKGRFTARLKSATASKVTALDISLTAVRIARARLPDLGAQIEPVHFLVSSTPPLSFVDKAFDLVVCSELLWYILPELNRFFEEVKRVLRYGGHLLIIQHFYKPEEQKYGREFMQTPEDLLNILPFEVVSSIEIDRHANHKFVVLVEKSA